MERLALLLWLCFGLQVAKGENGTNETSFVKPNGFNIYDVKHVQVFQSDFKDENFGTYGIDGDVTSCFVSGAGYQSWWKFVLNETLAIRGFLFKGYYDGLVKFRVGRHHEAIGDMTGHMVNPPCQALEVSGEQDYTLFECMVSVEGHVISVDSQAGEYDQSASLEICDVKVLI